MAATPPSPQQRPPDPLPEAVEERCYEIWFGPASERTDALSALRAEHPDHADAIDVLVGQLTRSDSVLGDVLGTDGTIEDLGSFGDYEIQAEIGRGGFGAVYRARQTRPVQREVAVKVLQPGRQSERAIARFSAERQALARMQHPSIAQVYDAGTSASGQPFIAMELIDGEPITDYCDHHQLDVDARLRLFVEVCAGVTHAHQRSVVHRDLKPSNILVIERDGAPRPVIIDFGLAKAMDFELGDGPAMTLDGGFFGTPAYTSPEQAAGRSVDARADVHALGLLLFELLTGDLAHGRDRIQGSSVTEALRIVRDEDPRAPSRSLLAMDELLEAAARARGTTTNGLVRRVRGDLDGIVLQAIERDPDRRYPSVAGLAEDVTRFLSNLPVAARRPTLTYVIGKLARRHRAALVVGILLLAALLVGATAVVWGSIAVEDARQRTAAQQKSVDWSNYAVDITAAKLALSQGLASKAIGHLDSTRPDLRGWEYHLLRRLADDTDIVLPVGGPVSGVHWLSDRLLAVVPQTGGVDVWDIEREEIVRSAHDNPGTVRRITPLGDRIHAVVPTQRGGISDVELVDLTDGRVVRKLAEASGEVQAVCVSADGARFAAYDAGETLQIGRVDGTGIAARWELKRRFLRSMAFTPDGESLILGSMDGAVGVVDRRREAIAPKFTTPEVVPHKAPVLAMTLDLDRNLLATADIDRIAVWNLDTGELRFVVATPTRTVSLEVDRESGTLYAGGGWGTAMVAAWDITTGERVATFDGHRLGVKSVAVSPDGTRLASGGADDAVRVWNTHRRGDMQVVPLGLDCRNLSYDRARNRASYCTMDGHAIVRDLDTTEPVMDLEFDEIRQNGEYCALAGDRMFLVGWDGVLRALDVATAQVVAETRIIDDGQRVTCVAAAPDGSSIAVTSADAGAVFVFDAESLEPRWLHRIDQLPGPPHGVWFSPDGAEVLLGTLAGHLLAFDATTGAARGAVEFANWPGDIAFTPNGQDLVVCTGGAVVLIARAGFRELRRFIEHNLYAASAAISPDGTRLATGGADGLVRIHDFATGTELAVFESREIGGFDLLWSPNGRRLYSRAHSWDMPSYLLVWDAGASFTARK